MSRRPSHCCWIVLACSFCVPSLSARAGDGPVRVRVDDGAGRLVIAVGSRDAVEYRYRDVDLPHFYPVKSPSGKLLTVERTEPYPHHRSLWFADTVQLAGRREASFYNALYSQVDRLDPGSAFRDRVRHLAFDLKPPAAPDRAAYAETLVWEMDLSVPVLDETRLVTVSALGDSGEYLLDLDFTLTAGHGDVTFRSDATHYAWPFVRMHPQFSVDRGGTLTNSEGRLNQAGTHGRRAWWVDDSNTVDGTTEGLAILLHDRAEPAPTWLTRDYGTFGVRRADDRNGKPFVLRSGARLHQRVGILVHRGDARAGRVAERHRAYADGSL